jgi:hypothetical protein
LKQKDKSMATGKHSKRTRPAQYAAQFHRTARNKANRIARIKRRKVEIPHLPHPAPLPSVQVANPIETFALWLIERGMTAEQVTGQLQKFATKAVHAQPPPS